MTCNLRHPIGIRHPVHTNKHVQIKHRNTHTRREKYSGIKVPEAFSHSLSQALSHAHTRACALPLCTSSLARPRFLSLAPPLSRSPSLSCTRAKVHALAYLIPPAASFSFPCTESPNLYPFVSDPLFFAHCYCVVPLDFSLLGGYDWLAP